MKNFYAILFLIPLFAFGAGCTATNQATDKPADTSVSDEGREIYPDDSMGGEVAIDDDSAMEDEVEDDSMMEESNKTYTIVEVAKHTTEDDCWFVIDGKVYDVSGFGDKHGGGESVYEGCGLDATELFETRPMGSGTPHSDKARSFMPNFEIGTLE
jgi:cytochrome b involved in lipid metabolism